MATLEEELQKIHDVKIGVCLTWLWDGKDGHTGREIVAVVPVRA